MKKDNFFYENKITYADIWSGNKILSRLIESISFEKGRGFLLFAIFIVLPLILSSLATKSEDRLFYGSLEKEIEVAVLNKSDYENISSRFELKKRLTPTLIEGDEYYYLQIKKLKYLLKENNSNEFIKYLSTNNKIDKINIKGMSYFGDPMVWPFYFLVFIALILLKLSSKKIELFFSNNYKYIKIDSTISKDIYIKTLNEVKRCLAHKGYWSILKYGSILLGVTFVVWNTISCAYPENFHPYESVKVFLFYENGFINLQTPVDIPKWDTNISDAPLSWLSSRGWVIFGYFLIPIILAKLINLVGAIFIFCLRIGSNNLLIVRAISEDNAGGFSSLSDVSLSFARVIIPFLIMALMSFMKEATPPSLHNYFLVLAFIPIFFAVFIIPIFSFHVAMKESKKYYLSLVSSEFNKFNEALFNKIKNNEIEPKEIDVFTKKMQALKEMHRETKESPDWPVEVKTVYRFIAGFSVPPALLGVITFFGDKLTY